MKPTKIDLGPDQSGTTWTGVEYSLGPCIVRKFDNGKKAYFFNTKYDIFPRRNYRIHVDYDTHSQKRFRMYLYVFFFLFEYEEFYVSASTRKELFIRMRSQIDSIKKAVRTIKLRKPKKKLTGK